LKSAYLNFAKSLQKYAIDFKIVNNVLEISEEVPFRVKDQFEEYFVLRIKPILAHHPMYGYFIVSMEAPEEPLIMWTETQMTEPPN
jgi:hypothetical protein